MIYFGFYLTLEKEEESVNRNFGTNRDLHWVIEILGPLRFDIDWYLTGAVVVA